MILSDHEIIRRLRTVRHSSQDERNARRAPSINAIATRAGLTREAVYRIIRTGSLGTKSRAGLSFAFATCELRFGVRLKGASPSAAAVRGLI